MKQNQVKAQFYLLTAILIAATALRIHQINQPFVDATSWRQSDTATIADNFYQGHWNILLPKISWNGPGENYVGYEFQTVTYIASILYRFLGHHDWVGRAVAVTFGIWGLFAFYQLVRSIWSEKHALLSTLILAILPGEIYVDRSFLPDPVMLSLVTTAAWLLIAYLKTERWHYLVFASLAGLLGFLTKIPGLMIGLPMLYAIVVTLQQRSKLISKQSLLLGLAAIAVLIPAFSYYRWAIHISHTYPPYYIAANQYWIWKFGISYFLGQQYFLPKLSVQLNWFWTEPFILLAAIGLLSKPPLLPNANSPRDAAIDRQISWFFHGWMIACIIYYLIAAQGLVNNPTNLNLANPAAAALIANTLLRGVALAERWLAARTVWASLLLVLFIFAGTGYHKLETSSMHPWANNDYRLGLALRDLSEPTDLVVTATASPGDTVAVYYSERRGWIFPPAYSWSYADLYDTDEATAIELLAELLEKGADWFGLSTVQKNNFIENKPQLMSYVEHNFETRHETPEFTIYRARS